VKVHKFNESIKVGNEGEDTLDNFFKDKFTIEDVDMKVQKMGIDRVFTRKKGWYNLYCGVQDRPQRG